MNLRVTATPSHNHLQKNLRFFLFLILLLFPVHLIPKMNSYFQRQNFYFVVVCVEIVAVPSLYFVLLDERDKNPSKKNIAIMIDEE